MSVYRWSFIVIAYLLGCVESGQAGSVPASFPIIATVYGAIQLTTTQQMSFGQQSAGTTLDINPAAVAKISVQANANSTVTGTFNSSLITLTCQSATCGTSTINVDAFTCSGTGFNPDCTGVMPSSQQTTVNITAVMHLTGQPAGTYTGTQTFSLAYS